MEVMFLPIISLLILYWLDIRTEAKFIVDSIMDCHYSLHRVHDNYFQHLRYTLSECCFSIDNEVTVFGDDPDVYAQKARVYFHIPSLSKKVHVPLADYYFYPEKSYKNRKEFILWQDNQESQELNYYEKQIKRLMTALVKRQLKKRLLESTKLTSHL